MAMTAPRWLLVAAAGAAVISGVFFQLMRQSPGPMIAGIFAGVTIGLLFAAVLRWQLPDACDSAPPQLRKRYSREMMVAMGGYAVLLFTSIWLLKHVDNTGLRAVIALLPVPPIAFATSRAVVSELPPAAKPTMKRTGRSGFQPGVPCATAGRWC